MRPAHCDAAEARPAGSRTAGRSPGRPKRNCARIQQRSPALAAHDNCHHNRHGPRDASRRRGDARLPYTSTHSRAGEGDRALPPWRALPPRSATRPHIPTGTNASTICSGHLSPRTQSRRAASSHRTPGHPGPDIRRNASKTQPRQVRDLRLRHSLSFPRATFTGGCHRWARCPPAPPSIPSRGNTGCRPHVPVCLLADCLCACRGGPDGQNPLATTYRGGHDGTTTNTHPCTAEPCYFPRLAGKDAPRNRRHPYPPSLHSPVSVVRHLLRAKGRSPRCIDHERC